MLSESELIVLFALRLIVDGGDVDRQRLGRHIFILAAVGRAAVVLHLEGDLAGCRAIGVSIRGRSGRVAVEVADIDEARRDRRAIIHPQ